MHCQTAYLTSTKYPTSPIQYLTSTKSCVWRGLRPGGIERLEIQCAEWFERGVEPHINARFLL